MKWISRVASYTRRNILTVLPLLPLGLGPYHVGTAQSRKGRELCSCFGRFVLHCHLPPVRSPISRDVRGRTRLCEAFRRRTDRALGKRVSALTLLGGPRFPRGNTNSGASADVQRRLRCESKLVHKHDQYILPGLEFILQQCCV